MKYEDQMFWLCLLGACLGAFIGNWMWEIIS